MSSSKYDIAYVPGKPFKGILIFVSKAWAYPSKTILLAFASRAVFTTLHFRCNLLMGPLSYSVLKFYLSSIVLCNTLAYWNHLGSKWSVVNTAQGLSHKHQARLKDLRRTNALSYFSSLFLMNKKSFYNIGSRPLKLCRNLRELPMELSSILVIN